MNLFSMFFYSILYFFFFTLVFFFLQAPLSSPFLYFYYFVPATLHHHHTHASYPFLFFTLFPFHLSPSANLSISLVLSSLSVLPSYLSISNRNPYFTLIVFSFTWVTVYSLAFPHYFFLSSFLPLHYYLIYPSVICRLHFPSFSLHNPFHLPVHLLRSSWFPLTSSFALPSSFPSFISSLSLSLPIPLPCSLHPVLPPHSSPFLLTSVAEFPSLIIISSASLSSSIYLLFFFFTFV